MTTRPSSDFAQTLQRQLILGVERLPERFRLRQAEYIAGIQNDDGGFPDRAGNSDLYYTHFALRAADLLRVDRAELWSRAASYVCAHGSNTQDAVALYCLLSSLRCLEDRECAPWPRRQIAERVDRQLSALRTGEGAVAKTPGGPGSVYHTFLAALCYELVDRRLPRLDEAVAFARARRCADGGVAESAAAGQASGAANPTAAAVALIVMRGAMDADTARRTGDFLVSMQRADGGFATGADAPVADLMSTFTALVALDAVGAIGRARRSPAARFAASQVMPSGGFRSSALDDAPDVEYTFYGVGALALLALETPACADPKCACRRQSSL